MRDFLPALALTLIASVIGFSTVIAAPPQGEMAVVFPPFTSEQQAWAAIRAAGGLMVGPTRISNVVVVFAPSEGFQAAARSQGALLFLKAEGLCSPQISQDALS